VFRDLDAHGPGVDYAAEIDAFIGSCDAVVVVIGNAWLDIRDEDGQRRLDDPDDLVRQEILAAFKAGKLVIPVLVEDARMPGRSRLPPVLAALAGRNALPVSDARWDYDVGVLVARLDEVVAPAPGPAAQPVAPAPVEPPGYRYTRPPASTSAPWSSPRPPPPPAGPGRSAGVPGWAWAAGALAVVVILVGVAVAVVALGGGSSKGSAADADAARAPTTPVTPVSSGSTGASVATTAPSQGPLPGETSITLSRSSGPVGTSITVSGAGFDARETVEVRFHVGIQATAVTDASGAFGNVVVKVPAGSFKGFPYEVVASGRRSAKSARAPFNVT
jgi:hypothetical protein